MIATKYRPTRYWSIRERQGWQGKKIAALAVTFVLATFPWDLASGQSVGLSRIDAPLGSFNSTFVSFGNGPTLQIPAYLLGDSDTASSLESPRRVRSLSFGFVFPTLAPSFEVVGENIVWDTLQKKPRPFRPDQFPVAVMKVFYRPPDGRFAEGTSELQHSPAQIEKRSLCCGQAKDGKGLVQFDMTRRPTGMPEIENVISTTWLQSHPGNRFDFKDRARYVSTESYKFDLSMICDGQEGVKCRADVLSRATHFQYELTFPSESVRHLPELLDVVDKIFLAWARP